MSMKVRVRFNGDVLVYDKNGFWNFVFITDQDHVVNLMANGQTVKPGGLRIAGKTRHMTLVPQGTSSRTRTQGADYVNILNLSESYLHGVDVGGASNLASSQASPSGREMLFLTANVGELDGADFACDYWIEDANDSSQHWEVGHKIARTVTLKFEVDSPYGVGLTATDPGDTEYFEWRYDEQGLDLHFDNDCHMGHGGRRDFLNYYDCVRDKRDGRQYVAGRVECTDTAGQTIRSVEGNCDPGIIDPGPVD